jgi:hypothetical protein
VTRWRVALLLAAAAALASVAAAQKACFRGRSDGKAGREPLAILDGQILTRDDIGGAVAFRIYQLEVDIHSLLQAETERRVDEILLAR